MPDTLRTYADFAAASHFCPSLLEQDEFTAYDDPSSTEGELLLRRCKVVVTKCAPRPTEQRSGSSANVGVTQHTCVGLTNSGLASVSNQGSVYGDTTLKLMAGGGVTVFSSQDVTFEYVTNATSNASPSDWVVFGSQAFEELDALRAPEGQLSRQISAFCVTSRLAYKDSLAERLTKLLAARREEEGWEDASSESLRHLLLFLETNWNLRRPVITVTPSATFRAQWTNSVDEHLALNFLSDGQVRFVVFCPDARHQTQIQRLSGLARWDSLPNVLAPFSLGKWVVARAR
jgi:hypothetical protein